MRDYLIAGVIGGLVSLYIYFWAFYEPDENVLKEFWKDFLQNSPIKSFQNNTFKRTYRHFTVTTSRFLSEEVMAYPRPYFFWTKLLKHFVLGAFFASAGLYVLYNY